MRCVKSWTTLPEKNEYPRRCINKVFIISIIDLLTQLESWNVLNDIVHIVENCPITHNETTPGDFINGYPAGYFSSDVRLPWFNETENKKLLKFSKISPPKLVKSDDLSRQTELRMTSLIKTTIPNYLSGLPLPDTFGGWFKLGCKF